MIGSDNIVSAFSVDHVVNLTGLSKGQIAYWDKTGFFQPNYGIENRRSPYSRIYSFRDVVGLRTIAILRNVHRISLQQLRRVAENLSHLSGDLWSATKLYVLNKQVHFKEPETGMVRGAVDGQFTMIELVRIADDVAEKVKQLKKRSPEQIGKAERHRFVARNAWVIAGTRIPVKAIQNFHAAGYTVAQILKEYPTLKPEDVRAALSHVDGKIASSA